MLIVRSKTPVSRKPPRKVFGSLKSSPSRSPTGKNSNLSLNLNCSRITLQTNSPPRGHPYPTQKNSPFYKFYSNAPSIEKSYSPGFPISFTPKLIKNNNHLLQNLKSSIPSNTSPSWNNEKLKKLLKFPSKSAPKKIKPNRYSESLSRYFSKEVDKLILNPKSK